MVPDPYEEFIIKDNLSELKEFDENPEFIPFSRQHRIILEIQRKKQMGERYDEYIKLYAKLNALYLHCRKKDKSIEYDKIKNEPRYIELLKEYLSIN
jgi:hypothetical protein